MTWITAERGLLAGGLIGPIAVRVGGDQIVEVVVGPEAADAAPIELGTLSPGFVDLQVNGAVGVDLAAADAGGYASVARYLAANGVTSFLATFITAPIDDLVAAIESAAALGECVDAEGARMVGLHIEGPFLADAFRGAHDPVLVRDPDPESVDRLLQAAPGLVRLITLAPERAGALEAIARITGAGAAVALGHTGADAATTVAAADAGATLVTHLFNAQRGLHHREPGIVGAALDDQRLHPSLIVDLHHVHPTVVRLAFAAAGRRTVLVSDAAAAAGMPAGRYELGDGAIIVDDPSLPPRREDGTLAGSSISLADAVRNCVSIGIPLATALTAASTTPAGCIGRDDLGRLSPGAKADLVRLDDNLTVAAVWLSGTRVPPTA